MTDSYPKAGQIWQECDPRQTRLVKVLSTGNMIAIIQKVTRFNEQSAWAPAPRTSPRQALFERFNGKRGGYKLIKDVNDA